MSKAIYCGLLLLISSMQYSYASETDIQNELKGYMDIFSGDNYASQRSAIEPLGWTGISDPMLYDLVEAKLLETYLIKGKVATEKASWFAKALALSGNEKYRATLDKSAENAKSKKVRKHSKLAIKRLAKYLQWNPVISSNLTQVAAGQLKQARIKNMLHANDPELVRIGAKRIYYAHSANGELVGIARERLKQGYSNVKDDQQVDAMAWLIKAISKSGDAKNKEVLNEIIATAGNKKLRKYAK